MNIKLTLASVIIVIMAALLAGCSDNDGEILTGNTADQLIARVSPPDGAVEVAATSSISVKFTGPVDTTEVMNNLHVSYGDMMHEWMDSVGHYGGMGQMGSGHRGRMMDWMDSMAVPGEFHWNGNLDSCEFVPDSGLHAGTEYMICLYEGGMMQNGSMMGGMGHGDDGYHEYHFMTDSAGMPGQGVSRVSPADGATGVPASTIINVTFDGPMDTLSIIGNFHIAYGDMMHEWMDSASHYGGMGNMGMGREGHMRDWMDSIGIPGEFDFHGTLDSCTFMPDSLLMPGTEYMIFMYEGGMRGHGGGMMGGTVHGDSLYHQYHFTTE